MNIIAGLITIIPLGLACPAAAQDADWVRTLERRLERAAERIEQRVDARLNAQDQTGERVRQGRLEAERRRTERLRQREELLRQRRNRVRQGPGVTEQVSKTVRLGRDGSLELSNAVGNVVVTGGGGDDIRIDATKRVWDPSDSDARTKLQEITIDITERTGHVDVRTVFPDRRRDFSAAVDYTIAVPSGASVAVRTVSGDVRITNVRGESRVDTINGAVTLSSVARLRALKSVSGDIQIDDAESTDLTVSTVNGTTTARRLKARVIEYWPIAARKPIEASQKSCIMSGVCQKKSAGKSDKGTIRIICQETMAAGESARVRRLMKTTPPAAKQALTSARICPVPKLSMPGRKMSIAPAKPNSTALQRLRRTFSFKMTIANTVANKGAVKPSAVTSATEI